MSDASIYQEERGPAAETAERSSACPTRPARLPQNISDTERLVSSLGGSALLLAGISHGRLSGLLTSLFGGALIYRGLTGHCHCYEALGLDTAEHGSGTVVPARQGAKVDRTIAVGRSPEELYAFWRRLENLPRVMRHLERVEEIDERRSRWVAKGPLGKSVQWEAELIGDREAELISWRSLPGGDVDSSGSVQFRPLGEDRGTEISVSLKYNPPAGKLGIRVASWLGRDLEAELDHDLGQFKSIMEAEGV